MEALEIESQTDQTPLASSSLGPTERELAEAQHLLDNADHRFDGAFASRVDGFAHRCLELVGHLDQGARVFRRRIRQWRETLLPTPMMGITARGDVRFDPALGTRSQGGRTKIASVQCRRLRRTNCGWNGLEGGFGFQAIVRVVGERISHNEQTCLIYGNLGVVILLKTSIRRVFHHARLWVGEVILVTLTRPWHRWRRRTTTRATSRRALPLRTLCHLGFIVGLLGCRTLLGTGLDHRFGLCQTRQPVLPARDLLLHHQPIGHLWLLALLGSDEEFFDLGSKLDLQLQQTLVTDGFTL